jgi:hypothetical protein
MGEPDARSAVEGYGDRFRAVGELGLFQYPLWTEILARVTSPTRRLFYCCHGLRLYCR